MRCGDYVESLEQEIINLKAKTVVNTVPEALDILREAMKDRSEGELYHVWMVNIKFAIYDSIMRKQPCRVISPRIVGEQCEEGARNFLDRLLQGED